MHYCTHNILPRNIYIINFAYITTTTTPYEYRPIQHVKGDPRPQYTNTVDTENPAPVETPQTSTEAINEPENIDPETGSDVEFIGEVSKKPKPTPEVVDIENVCKQEQTDEIKKEPKQEPGTNTPTPGTSGIDPLEFERMRAQLERLTNLI